LLKNSEKADPSPTEVARDDKNKRFVTAHPRQAQRMAKEAVEKVEKGPGAAGQSRLGKKNKRLIGTTEVVPCYKAFQADFFSSL